MTLIVEGAPVARDSAKAVAVVAVIEQPAKSALAEAV